MLFTSKSLVKVYVPYIGLNYSRVYISYIGVSGSSIYPYIDVSGGIVCSLLFFTLVSAGVVYIPCIGVSGRSVYPLHWCQWA